MKKQINLNGKRILKNKEARNQMEFNGENIPFITLLKDHKENFSNEPTVRLINPAKENKLRHFKYLISISSISNI